MELRSSFFSLFLTSFFYGSIWLPEESHWLRFASKCAISSHFLKFPQISSNFTANSSEFLLEFSQKTRKKTLSAASQAPPRQLPPRLERSPSLKPQIFHRLGRNKPTETPSLASFLFEKPVRRHLSAIHVTCLTFNIHFFH